MDTQYLLPAAEIDIDKITEMPGYRIRYNTYYELCVAHKNHHDQASQLLQDAIAFRSLGDDKLSSTLTDRAKWAFDDLEAIASRAHEIYQDIAKSKPFTGLDLKETQKENNE